MREKEKEDTEEREEGHLGERGRERKERGEREGRRGRKGKKRATAREEKNGRERGRERERARSSFFLSLLPLSHLLSLPLGSLSLSKSSVFPTEIFFTSF